MSEKRKKIVLLALAVHILLLIAAADVYFSSPLDKGMNPVCCPKNQNFTARRIILIVADGLRASSVYDTESETIPFLRNVCRNRGSWGTAHTRVPTESRPGHVAMLAGIYEDPSAVFKGWKANPVKFDHVIEQSAHAYCWGSPDIINVFSDRPTTDAFTYGPEMEDFGKSNTSALDAWVFDKVTTYLKENKEGIIFPYTPYNIFFLHLLGIDTAGHGFKPKSEEYISNIRMVDSNIEKIEKAFADFFLHDNKTVFIFTSDHGMTNWGSHGAGSDDETKVPFIIWGHGIKKNPTPVDLKQIDIAPLMSCLLGINIPVNSLGILPYQYLDVPEKKLAEMIKSNIKQLMEILLVKAKKVQKALFQKIKYEMSVEHFNNEIGSLERIDVVIDFDRFLFQSTYLMKQIVEGINYYHTYFKPVVLVCVSVGFFSWLVYLVLMTLSSYEDTMDHVAYFNIPKLIFYIIFVSIVQIAVVYLQSLPYLYCVYFSFPLFVGYLIALEISKVRDVFNLIRAVPIFSLLKFVVIGSLTIKLFLLSFKNSIWISVAVILQSLWIYVSLTFDGFLEERSIYERNFWMTINTVLALIGVVPKLSYFVNIASFSDYTNLSFAVFVIGFIVWCCMNYKLISKVEKQYSEHSEVNSLVLKIQFTIFVCTFLWICLIEYDVITSNSILKVFSWILFIFPVALIPFTAVFTQLRFTTIVLAFAPFYLMMSRSYETVYMAVYIITLYSWIRVESCTLNQVQNENFVYKIKYDYSLQTWDKRNPSIDDMRRAFQYICFILVGFFGFGNVASINSFDPMWTKCFVTVFSPFTMTGLIVLKMCVPFLYATCAFRAVVVITRTNLQVVFCAILFISDVMLIPFLYSIKNVGSWLEIGTTISYFIVMEAFILIILLLYWVAHALTTFCYEGRAYSKLGHQL